MDNDKNLEVVDSSAALEEGLPLSPRELARQRALEKRWVKNDWLFWGAFIVAAAGWSVFMTGSVQTLAQEYEPLYPAMQINPLDLDGADATYLLIAHANW
jgi:hypothetical protein